MNEKKIKVLIIEDNEPDADILQETIHEINDNIQTLVIPDGQEAIDYLLNLGKDTNEPYKIPNLIILDLNLPTKSGFEVLIAIRNDDCTRSIPVIIHTSSKDELDVWVSYQNFANSYIIKGFDIEKVIDKVGILCEYWFNTAELPDIENIDFLKGEQDESSSN